MGWAISLRVRSIPVGTERSRPGRAGRQPMEWLSVDIKLKVRARKESTAARKNRQGSERSEELGHPGS